VLPTRRQRMSLPTPTATIRSRSMQFSAQQERALQSVSDWLKGDDQVFRLFGFAGTGKTTLARHIGADLYAAFTGKAAYVMRQKGCPAQTIHSLIYNPRDKSTLRLKQLENQLLELAGIDSPEAETEATLLKQKIREEHNNLKRPLFTLNLDSELRYAKLLVIDECSMVDEEMATDLLSFGTKILVLGDPAQLPPVRGTGFFTNAEPDFLLTEIHRQARENPILDLATRIREDSRLPSSHPCLVPEATMKLAINCDQVIVGRNHTRRAGNRRIREELGFTGPTPQVGEKVVCLRNNHEVGILNGATYEVTEADDCWLQLDGNIEVIVHREPFVGEEVDWWNIKQAELFDFGYVLTCHKAQGSQWDKVGVINEAYAFRHDRWRWLYTAVTRAAETLWVA